MSLIDEFREALTAEVEEQKKKGTARWEVREGRLVEVRGPLYVYSFVLDDPTLAGAFDDTPVRVHTAVSDASGHVVGVSGVQIYVAIESNLGEYVPSAQILAQPYYLLELLCERLASLQESSCVIANKCLRLEQFKYLKDEDFIPDQHIQPLWDRLNTEQKNATRQALGSEVCYIWGPPGTGKTTTVGVAVASMIQNGSTVLLTSNTNAAVDQALRACLRLLVETDEYRDGRILRLGTPQIEEIRKDDNISLDNITERKCEPLREQLTKIRDELAEAEHKLTELESLRANLERLEAIQASLIEVRNQRGEIENLLDELANRASFLNQSIKTEQERYERANMMPGLLRAFRGMTLTGIANTISRLSAENDAISEKTAQAQIKLKETTGRINSLEKEDDVVGKGFKQAPTSIEELDSEIEATKARADDHHGQIKELQSQIEVVRQQVLDQAVLVATTLARTHTMDEVYKRQFDTLICDEASMAPIPAVYWACSLANKSVVVVGDFRQLAPIAISKDSKVKDWLRRDVFVAAGIDKEWQLEQAVDTPMVMLKTQYRMQPQIRSIVSSVFYNDQLQDDIIDEPSSQANQPCPGSYAGIYDTSTIDPWCSWTSSYSRFNLYHAVLAVRLCQIAIHDFDDIGIITPYKAQTRLIKVLVDMEPALRGKVIVSNVHRFQGNEKDLIIFDLVDSTGLPVGKLLKGRIDSEDVDDQGGARLINVACSRARKKLAVIANLSYFEERLKDSWSIYEVINKIRHMGTFPAEQLVPGYSDPTIHQAREVLWHPDVTSVATSSFWTEDNFHNGLRHDLENAKQSAIIMSPFITRARLQTYMDLLRAKREQGVNLALVTRPPYQQGMQDKDDIEKLLSYLEKFGIRVDKRRSMHQKVVVIDGHIVWFGSLNPLSHRNTQELMFRLENENFTKQVMDECGLRLPGEESEIFISAVDITKIPPRSCSKCGGRMKVIPKGRYGPFYKCEKCKSTANIRQNDLNQAILPEAKTCPKCGREMEIKRSRTGVFLGCSGFRDKENQCKYTRPL